MSHRRGRGRESSTGRLAHPPHSMRVVEACSTAAPRGAAFVRPHCRPHITEVHSAAVCAASAQSPSAALMDMTARHLFIIPPTPQATRPFSYAAGNAASYTLAPFRQDGAWICWTEESRGQARESRNEISFACNAIMYEQYVILYYIDWAHLSGTQRPCTRLL